MTPRSRWNGGRLAALIFALLVACGSEEQMSAEEGSEGLVLFEESSHLVERGEEQAALETSEVLSMQVVEVEGLSWEELAPGLRLFDGTVKVDLSDFRIVAVEAGSEYALGIAASTDSRASGHSLQYFGRTHMADVALSGGYLASFVPAIPLGGVVVGGEKVNGGVRDTFLNGVIRSDGRSRVIERYGGVPEDAVDLLQSGPLLVKEGHVAVNDVFEGSLSDEEKRSVEGERSRAFVGLGPDNRVVMGVTDSVSLADLAEVLVRPRSEGGLGVVSALNLSGGATRGLLIRTDEGWQSFFSTETRIPTALILQAQRSRQEGG